MSSNMFDHFEKIWAISDAEFIEDTARMLSIELKCNLYSNSIVTNYIKEIIESSLRIQKRLQKESNK